MSSATSARTKRSSAARSSAAVRSSRRSKSPDLVQGEQPGLRRIVQDRILKDVFESASDKYPGWKVLIVDEHSMRVISATVGMYDIMERKVTVVEALEKKRAPFTDMGAIYILEPTRASVELLVQDFGRKPLYGKAVFLYFLGRLPDDLFGLIKNCAELVKRLKSLTEINIDFLAKEERAFSFDMRETFAPFYLRNDNARVELAIAQKLVTVCGTLNEYPHIRYKNDSAICSSLANLFKYRMDEFVSQNPSWWYHGGPKKNHSGVKERGTLLILDRADDCLSPLMHDFTYQPMVHDLLTMDGDCITYKNDMGNKTDVLLDEKDTVWVELRGKHIAAVIETLSNRIREITSSSTGSALNTKQGQGTMSLSQMASALKALPEYQEVMSKLSQHMHLSHQCMDTFTSKSLLDLAEIEQTLATGKDEDGRSPRLGDIMDKAESAIVKMKTASEKLRLILVAVIACGGLRAQDRRRLTAAAELSGRELRMVDALEVLGLAVVNANDKNSNLKGLPNRLSKDDESEYAGFRYVPALKSTLEALAMDELSLDDYPSVTPMPQTPTSSVRSSTGAASSARKRGGDTTRWSAASSARKEKRSGGPANLSGGRNIVFVMGGVCYSELRVALEVMENHSREIIIGSTAFVTANEFMEDLGHLVQR